MSSPLSSLVRWSCLALVLLSIGCGGNGEQEAAPADAGDDVASGDSGDEVALDSSELDSAIEETAVPADSAAADSTLEDTSTTDTGESDSSALDTGTADTDLVDSTVAGDTGSLDTGSPDTGSPDTGPFDTGPFDTGALDTGTADTGPFDTGAPDTGPFDTGPFDTGAADSGPADTGTPAVGCVTSIDLQATALTGTVTLAGGTLPSTSKSSDQIFLYLRAKDTGVLHEIHRVGFGGSYPTYTRASGSESYATRVPPGQYELLFSRGYTSTDTWTYKTDAADPYVNGRRVLQSSVTIPTGSFVLDIDLPAADVSGSITLNGAALPTTSKSSDQIFLYLRAKDTGVFHEIHRVGFGGSYPTYTRASGSESYATRVPPGVYDLWFSRGYTSTDTWTYKTDSADPFVNGRRVLQSGVVIPAGSFALNIDLPASPVTGNVTFNGGALPTTSKSSDQIFLYLRAKDTGVLHEIHRIGFGGSYPTYTRASGSESYATRVPAGTYDLIFSRGYTSTDTWTYKTDSADPFVNGRRVLQADVVVPNGPFTLDVDLKATALTGNVTLNGGALPTTSKSSDQILFYLRAKDTGVLHEIHRVGFGGSYPTYTRAAGSESYATRIPAGTYDLIFSRGYTSTDSWTYKTDAADPFVNGRRVLAADVVIPAGAFALDIDVKSTSLTGNFTLNGAPLPMTSKSSDQIFFYLRAKDTGVLHEIHRVGFGGSYPTYTRASGSEAYSTRVPPGNYDLIFSRGYTSADTWTYKTDPADPFVNGRRILVADVAVPSGSYALDIDVKASPLAGAITLNGMPLPTTSKSSDQIFFYLRAKDTNVFHEIHRVGFGGSYPTYTRAAGSELYSTRLPPGQYELWFSRGYTSTDTWTYKTDAADPFVNGRRILGTCVQP